MVQPTPLSQAITRLRKFGYTIEPARVSSISAHGKLLEYTVGSGLATHDDILALASGLDHPHTGDTYQPGEAVQLLSKLSAPVTIPSGSIGIVEEVYPEQVRLRFGNVLGMVALSAIEPAPVPEKKTLRLVKR